MNAEIIKKNGLSIAVVFSNDLIIIDASSALEFVVNIIYQTESDRIVLNKEAITEDFFKLSTRLAGDVLQKFINYRVKLAIVGDFSNYTSKPLKDFIYESNNGSDIFFVSSVDDAIEKLSIAN